MKLSVLANLYGKKSLDEALQILTGLGVHTVELGAGGYPGKAHCNPAELLADEAKYTEFMNTLKKYDVTVCALSAHGNALHPNKAIAKQFDEDFRNAVLLAEKMGVDTVITFSGCPGDSDGSKYPNWVTCPWPEDFLEILNWQWNEKLIPYWKEAGAFAEAHHVPHIAFEMHPGFCVYNAETLLKLRAAVGPVIGANFDPSHLIWQGVDPVAAIRALAGAIYHVHATTRQSTVCLTRSTTATSCTALGSSARSATATARLTGAISFPICVSAATTAFCRSSMRTAS